MLRRATALKRICDRQRVQNAYKAIFLIQSIIDADNMERRRQQFKDH